MVSEVIIKLKDSHKQLVHKSLVHGNIMASFDDETITQLREKAISEFGSEYTKISITIKLFE